MNSITHACKGRNRDCQYVAVTHTDLCKVVMMQMSKDYIPIHVFHSLHLPFVASGGEEKREWDS